MPVSDDGCMKKMKHVTCFGQLKILSANIVVTDGQPVSLLQFNFELLWKLILFIKYWKRNSVNSETALNFITPNPLKCPIRNKASTILRFVTDCLLVMPSQEGNDDSQKKLTPFRQELVIMSNSINLHNGQTQL
jgi:hypothetical protein